ncbi:Uma2 family endonuclease [Actinocorallia lasiicapitis]
MTVARVHSFDVVLHDSPFALWASGELADTFPNLPAGSTIEIIGGEIVIRSAPGLEHQEIVGDILDAFRTSERAGGDWHAVPGTALGLVGVGDGLIPDLTVGDSALLAEARAARVRYLVPDQVEIAVEVTSYSNADSDRQPEAGKARKNPSKWSCYAAAAIPLYLLIDGDPRDPRVTLYSIPDATTGAYLQSQTWKFGETVVLPEHIGVTFPTDKWWPWHPAAAGQRAGR